MGLGHCGTLMTQMSRFTRLEAMRGNVYSLSAGFCSVTTQTPTSTALAEYIRDGRHPRSAALFTAQQPISLETSRISYRRVHQCWETLIAPYPDLKGARLHDLRHTFATERVGLMGIEELRALMGHESIQTTLRYQKVTSRRAESVAKQALEMLL